MSQACWTFPTCLPCASLASRGAHFGDASLNITYRNVCRLHFKFQNSWFPYFTLDIYPECCRRTRRILRYMGSPDSQSGTERGPCLVIRLALPLGVFVTSILRSPRRPSVALTGIFLFATTTARSSNGLLGWNCGYSFFSNVITPLPEAYYQGRTYVQVYPDHVRGAIRHFPRNISSQG